MKRRKKYNSLQFWRSIAESDRLFIQQLSQDVTQVFLITPEAGTTLYIRGLVSNNKESGNMTSRLRQQEPRHLELAFYERNDIAENTNYSYKFPLIKTVGDGTKNLQYRMAGSKNQNSTIWGWTDNTTRITT